MFLGFFEVLPLRLQRFGTASILFTACWSSLLPALKAEMPGATAAVALKKNTDESERPNVVVIVTDDQGWGDIGYNNPNVYTPNLDRMSANGLKFNQHYVMPQCTPTRLALMTGRYPGRFGTTGLRASNEPIIPAGTTTVASMLRSGGYRTFLTGKWHLGSSPEHGPNNHGFEYSYGALAGAVGAYVHQYRVPGKEDKYSETWHRNHKIINGYENGKHVTDLITEDAIQVIRRKHDKPFFLYLPYFAPHTPLDERGKFVDTPTQLDKSNPQRWLNEDDIKWFHDPRGLIQQEQDPEKRLFLAVLHHLDHAIGQVVAELEKTQQRKNTVIFFTSDNGPQNNWKGGRYPSDLKLTNFNQPIPFRGEKCQVYEGGIRVPAFVNWPGKIRAGESDTVHHIVDWLPTIASLAGVKAKVEKAGPAFDGHDFSAELMGDSSSLPVRDIYSLHNPRTDKWALRFENWKVVHYGRKQPTKQDWQLYDLSSDPKEKKNVAGEHAEKVAELHERFMRHRKKDKTARNVAPLSPTDK